ncbi:hypothetical protein VIGAN_11071200 [Vigna angularis var. angularis]|uniref:Uncharacterized protein n=1 Tax=Vigna angularis var. angularis TaxID=157739 RepID=A0A0S3T8E3_PHAAN|nr:hypothetical protein VIGAN_11071200 [Vigna angularis var. angularis]
MTSQPQPLQPFKLCIPCSNVHPLDSKRPFSNHIAFILRVPLTDTQTQPFSLELLPKKNSAPPLSSLPPPCYKRAVNAHHSRRNPPNALSKIESGESNSSSVVSVMVLQGAGSEA